MYSTTRIVTLVSLILPLTSAFSFNGTWTTGSGSDNQTIDTTISPSLGISDACVDAYSMNLDCTENFMTGLASDGDLESALEARCTDQCSEGLRKWRDAIRSDCTTEDIQKANATASPSSSGDEGYSEGPYILVTIADKAIAATEYLYWSYCIRDLNTGEFCAFSSDMDDESKWVPANTTDPDYNATNIPAFCNSSCLTQQSAFMYEVVSTMGSVDDYADVREICPDVDISTFPFIESLQPTDGSSTSGSSNSTGSGSSSNSTTSPNSTGSPNSAGSLKAVSFLGSTLIVSVVVAFGLL